jgi:hypothetical protein
MSDEDKSRFEFCVRSHFNKSTIKNMMYEFLGRSQSVNEEMVICVASLAKMYAGDLVETGNRTC